MAIVNYGVVSPSLTLTVQMELSDADSERIVAYLMAATPYGTVTENVITDIPNPAWSPDQPDPLDPPEFIQQQSWVTRPATPEEAVTAYAESVMNSILQQAYQWDQQQAAAEAAANVPPITPIKPPAPVPPQEP
jgi:hypothetical protein